METTSIIWLMVISITFMETIAMTTVRLPSWGKGSNRVMRPSTEPTGASQGHGVGCPTHRLLLGLSWMNLATRKGRPHPE